MNEREQAREEQLRTEQARLAAHERIGAQLAGSKERSEKLLMAARAEVQRWASLQLCTQDYIDRWNEWLALPVSELVARMCSDADGWGTAMLQNSPFVDLR